jgi:triosephosphate isomerase
MAKALEGSGIALGAQNVFYELEGAFTGELAPGMLAETGVRYVLIGHSERRHVLSPGEDDWTLNRKVHAALRVGLVPVLCVGETLDQRQADQTDDVLAFQVAAGLSGTRISGGGQLVIAYEPVWAIGTGQNATPEQAQNAHARIRALLKQRLGAAGEEVRILYGGSLKPDNARVILAQPDVDGGLVGGASLKAESFLGILAAAMEA